MAKKMLYVSDEDEAVWARAKKLGARTDASLSKLVALALNEYVGSYPSALPDGVEIDGDIPVRKDRGADTSLTNRLRELLKQFGRDRVALAYSRACYAEGAREHKTTAALAIRRRK